MVQPLHRPSHNWACLVPVGSNLNEGRPGGVISTEVDHRLVHMYGDNVNRKYECHLDRGIVDDKVWQVQWRLLEIQSGLLYCAPCGEGRPEIH